MRAMALGLALLMAAPAGAQTPSPIAAAVMAHDKRSADNVKLDADRKPDQVLAFFGLEKGMRVLDLFGGNRYWAEIMAPAVGPDGSVTVWNPSQFMSEKARATFADFARGQGNVVLMLSPMQTPILMPDSYDFAVMNLDYHDLYWESEKFNIPRMDPDAWIAQLYAAMKPGGIVALTDHSALPGGDTRAVVEKLHRIDPAVAKADFERAGFVVEATSDLLANPADDHTKNVFDEGIRGKTDRFMMKLRKPGK